jgi:ABC-2 type transport system ATP-binding protein
MYAINAQNLNKVYKDKYGHEKVALNDLNIAIEQGSFFGLLGPNGAGKSTFINILAGITIKTSGKVMLCGYDLDKDPTLVRSKLGIVPQEVAIDTFFTVKETLEFYAGYFGIKAQNRKTKQIIEALGLADKTNVSPRNLSGGMKRRLLVAKALVNSPEVLILDEPTAGVDIDLRKQLWAYVKDLNNNGTTIILTTHYLEEAQELCDNIAIINHGQIIACDKTENLLHRLDQKQLIVQFSQVLTSVPQILIDFNAEITNEGSLLIKYRCQDQSIDHIISLIKQTNFTITDLVTKEVDLEDIFSFLVK